MEPTRIKRIYICVLNYVPIFLFDDKLCPNFHIYVVIIKFFLLSFWGFERNQRNLPHCLMGLKGKLWNGMAFCIMSLYSQKHRLSFSSKSFHFHSIFPSASPFDFPFIKRGRFVKPNPKISS